MKMIRLTRILDRILEGKIGTGRLSEASFSSCEWISFLANLALFGLGFFPQFLSLFIISVLD